jgi:outer membrane protein assembly factor BamD
MTCSYFVSHNINGYFLAIYILCATFDQNSLILHSFMKFLKVLLIVVSIGFAASSCNKYAKVMKTKDYEFKLKKADELYEAKKYKISRDLYEELFPVFKGTQKFEDIYYKFAYCHYYMKLYPDAENLFKGFLEVFPNSTKAEEVDYMHAYCFYKQSPRLDLEQVNTTKSMGMMQTFINTHPGSARIKDATEIIDKCRAKLEQKEFKAANLYYKIGQYRAAAISFSNLMNNYPESASGEEYKLMVVKAYYQFAKLSITEKQIERFEKVISEYQDFADRYPESKLLKDAESYSNLSQNNIKEIKNEQATTSAKR